MAYERVNWENLPSTNTPVNADNLNKMDVGIANAVEKTGDTMTGALTLKKTSYNYNGGAIPGTRQAAATTIEGLINELRYTNGQIGSVNISTAYTLNNITISAGWYNYSYIPHRSGGTDGGANSVNGDNTNFGTLMLTGMNISSPIYVLRYNSGVIQELTSLATTNVTKNLQTQINNLPKKVRQIWGPSMSFEMQAGQHALVMINNSDCLMFWMSGSSSVGMLFARLYGSGAQVTSSGNTVTIKYSDNRSFTGNAIIT